MLTEFRRRVHRELIDYLINIKTYNHGYLNVVHCVYKKDLKFYLATSYFTDYWIAKQPTGPTNKTTDMGKLRDIAVVREFEDRHKLNMAVESLPKEKDLGDLIHEFCMQAQRHLRGLDRLCVDGDTVEWAFSPVPVPTLTAKFRSKSGRLLGVIVFYQGVEPFVSFCCSDTLLDVYLPKCRQLWSGGFEGPKTITGLTL